MSPSPSPVAPPAATDGCARLLGCGRERRRRDGGRHGHTHRLPVEEPGDHGFGRRRIGNDHGQGPRDPLRPERTANHLVIDAG